MDNGFKTVLVPNDFAISTSRSMGFPFCGIDNIQAGLDFHLMDRLRVRFAYQAFWLLGTTTTTSQVDTDLSTQGSREFGSKAIMYHGPQLEVMFLF